MQGFLLGLSAAAQAGSFLFHHFSAFKPPNVEDILRLFVSANQHSAEDSCQSRTYGHVSEILPSVSNNSFVIHDGELTHSGTVAKQDLGKLGLDIERLWRDLIEKGYINEKGQIQGKFEGLKSASEMQLRQEDIGKRDDIWGVLQQPHSRLSLG